MTTVLFCDACGSALSTQAYLCPVCGHVQQPQAQMVATQHSSFIDELQPGSLLRERYRIQKKIGAGGFGLVYKAWDEQRRRQVAIKQITLAALSAREMIEATDSYNREVTFLPKLRHKNLPSLYHHFTDPGHWYIVMQYIDGKTLEELLTESSQGHLPVGKVLHIGAALCDVLGYLHQQEPSIVFRDVKPANIMHSSRDRIYLIDFGIARLYREGQRKDTRPLGSPGYAAPEQYGKAQSTPRTDMYGLGATLQTLLTGKEPEEIRANGIPADCCIPEKVQALISQMLEPNPAQRPMSMWSMRDTLRKLQKRYPIPTPFSWWIFFSLFFLMGIEPFFLSGRNQGFPLLGLFLILVILGYNLFKARRTLLAGKLTRKEIRVIVEKSMDNALQVIVAMWGLAHLNLILTALPPHFDAIMLIKAVLYMPISFVSLFLISIAWSRLLNKVKGKPSALPQQQAIQMPPMEQKIR